MKNRNQLMSSHYFRVRAAFSDHTLRGSGCPSPLPTPQGAGIGNSGTCPRPSFEGLRQAALGTRGHFGKPIQEGVPGLQRGPRAKSPPATNSIFRSNSHLPAMVRPTGGSARWCAPCSFVVHLASEPAFRCIPGVRRIQPGEPIRGVPPTYVPVTATDLLAISIT